MRSIKQIVSLIIMLACLNAFGQNRKLLLPEKAVLDVTISDFGKCPYGMKIGNIDQKYITSALYVYLDSSSKITPVPVNDHAFNYDYFHEVIYPQMSGRKVKLKVEKYTVKGKIIYIAYNIE
jgi:hypothetical protein